MARKHGAVLFEVIQNEKRVAREPGRPGALQAPGWFRGSGPAPAHASAPAVQPPSEVQRLAMGFDRQRQQIAVRLSYTGAAVIAFAVLMVIAVAYIIGQHVNPSGTPMLSRPTEDIRKDPPQRDVANVGGSVGGGALPLLGVRESTGAAAGAAGITGASSPGAVPAPAAKRAAGLNYIVIQGYPEEKEALEARDILLKNGVSVTVENGLDRGLRHDWFYVVGTDGFARISAPEYEAYIKRIQRISSQYAGQRSFKAFGPFGYKWDR